MYALRMLNLPAICCLLLFKVGLTTSQCKSYSDLAGKHGANCSYRSLVSVPRSLPLDTEILLLSYNNLTTVSLSSLENLPNLRDIDLSNNQIQHFDPDRPFPIEKLDLSKNSLTRIPDISNLKNLKKLILDYNKIHALPQGAFNDLVLLEELSISGNAIRVIPENIFDPLENLKYLTLSANNIEKFGEWILENIDYLDTFDISNNNLRSIPPNFLEIIAPYIYLYNNPWHCHCDTVEDLIGWINLNDGNIYNNRKEADSKSVVCSTPSEWVGIPIIEFPFQQICQIVTPETVPQESTVTERSQITTFHGHLTTSLPLGACVSYTDLAGKQGANCSYRSLVSVPRSLPLDTEILLLSYNNLTTVSLSSLENLPNLRDIDLSNNQIRHFDPDRPFPIEKLDLSANSLIRIPDFSNLKNLRKLILNYNKIHALPEGAFNDLVSLEELSISGNAIRVIPENIFDPLENLKYLTLSANNIEKFGEWVLENIDYLDTFDISNNNLRSIPPNFLEIIAPYIYLYNNPWHCHCDTVEDLIGWINLNDGNIYNNRKEADSKSVVCSTPSEWVGIPIIEFPFQQICQIVTTETVPQESTVTERSQITTFHGHLTTSLPLGACVVYTDLAGKQGANCSYRSLVSVPRSLPLDTEILLLSYNNLTTVSLSSLENLPNLRDIDLSNNQIRHFEPDRPLPIEKLDLSANSLTRIPDFSNLQNLRKLILDYNKIHALPKGAFEELKKLGELSISGNTIQVIPANMFDPLKSLKHLTLSANNIENFPKNALDNMQYLDLFDISNNNLQSIPEDFVNLIVPYIYLYNNPWHCHCDTVEDLIGWINLNDGNIYNNRKEADSKSVVCSTPSEWVGIPIIEFPFQQICQIVTTETVPQESTVTERSQITTFHGHLTTSLPLGACVVYTDLAGKQGANCSYRSLVSVPRSLPLDTEILLLSYNNLTTVSLSSLENLPNLRDIDLSNNQIQHFDPDRPFPIEKLDLSANSLTRIPDFSNLKNLRKLILNYNKIHALPEGAFNDLVSLEELSISGNAIRVIPENIFDPVENLKYLTLSANNIENLPSNPFHNLKRLTTLNISHNQLRTIPAGSLEGHSKLNLCLSNNPWLCNCDIQYLIEWIRGVNQFRDEGTLNTTDVCSDPPEMRGVYLLELHPSELCMTSLPGNVTMPVLSTTGTQTASPTWFLTAGPGDALNRWAPSFALLEALGMLRLSCFPLFLLHSLWFVLLLLESCLLLFYTLRFHRQGHMPMKYLAKRRLGIRLVRYSLLVPSPRQIYPALSPFGEVGDMEEAGGGHPQDGVFKSQLEDPRPSPNQMVAPAHDL
ncbi:slit homolog 3 protein-like [Stegostoma tigrinum]|uniref:slit homolog 3 protein-like n=1 Tax=Stegostoma tigrinum TaxID=3053191 RepID=UPI00287085D0|nr:slit homolog 3 protein-like [Stegostoma tigrinum]